MKTWKRISALLLSISTMGISILSAGCDLSSILGTQSSSSIDSLESSSDSSESVHTHTWTEEITKAATCTEDGEKVIKCDCGEQQEEVIPAGHDLVTVEKVKATCTQDGYTYFICNNCEYNDYEVEEKKGHFFLFGECVRCGESKDGGGTPPNPPTPNTPSINMGDGFWAGLAESAPGGGLNPGYSGEVTLDGNPTAIEAYDGSPVTITFYHTMGAVLRDVLNQALVEFNSMYPNITVVHETQGGYPDLRDQIVTEINAGDSPNLAYCYADHVALYNKAKVVATLDDYMASTAVVTKADGSTEQMGFTHAQANDFVRGFYEEGRAFGDGRMYTLPFSKSTEVLYYNKTFFEENNLSVPTTWDEMEVVMQQIMEIDPLCTPLGYDSEANWFITMCEQLGTPYTSTVYGEKFLFDMETNHQFMERLREWYQNGYVITQETYGAYTSDLFAETDPDRWNSYMCIGSSAGASYHCPDPYSTEEGQVVYPFEVGVTQIPQIDVNNPKVLSQGPSLCMFKKTNRQEMAATWLLMKFLTTNLTMQARFSATSGYAPVIKDLDEKVPAYADLLDRADGNANLVATTIKQCLAQQSAMFASPAFVGSAGVRDQVSLLMQNCFMNAPKNGQTTADFIKEEFGRAIDVLCYEYGA